MLGLPRTGIGPDDPLLLGVQDGNRVQMAQRNQQLTCLEPGKTRRQLAAERLDEIGVQPRMNNVGARICDQERSLPAGVWPAVDDATEPRPSGGGSRWHDIRGPETDGSDYRGHRREAMIKVR